MPKPNVIVANALNHTDGSAYQMLCRVESPIPIVLVSWADPFKFNEELLKLRTYILICFCEYGWDFEIKESHIWGRNTDTVRHRYKGEEWDKFDNWVRSNPPALIFKRELLKKDTTPTILPIEYPCLVHRWELQSKEQFNARPISALQYWGRSNECRLRVHGEFWLHAFKKGFHIIDNLYYVNDALNNERGEKWATFHIPWYSRIEVHNIMSVNAHSKLSLSLPGAGFKCFRSAEAPVNSVMVMHKNDFAWSYPWDETNCVFVEKEKEIEGIETALANPNLYDIYANGVSNSENYREENYIPNYIEKNINKSLYQTYMELP